MARSLSIKALAVSSLALAHAYTPIYPRNTTTNTTTSKRPIFNEYLYNNTMFQDGMWRVMSEQAAAGLCDDRGFDENPPDPLPPRATELDKMWQPSLDFDTDSCYNVPAIGPDGHIDAGRSRHESNTEGCRDEYDLTHSNVYSRQRCNHGWCAYLYDYFFEKDIGDRICIGHQYDWEHVVVWTKDGKPRFGAVSRHGGWDARLWEDIPLDGDTHVKAVYNKDGLIGTHYFRWSKGATDEPPENHKGVWWRSDLISWNGFPDTALRDKLTSYDFDAATMAIRDDTFAWNLERSAADIRGKLPDFEFDFNLDVGSPGDP
ncbi:necrosis inducing [Purpureocillium lavendulum]|uniref:Necrosis inducing n=1 Tax=Purpureocillium lavendulum TaxID=1247861 RepID=A0AB34FEB8_9HYPO|nr:necrosis inducing [Purpureocillium lavendulum]